MPPIVSEEYKKKKKKDILSSALSCFAKKGFEAATIDDIVAHSGISKGAIYNYFKSKEEIFLELMNSYTEEMNELLYGKIASYQSASEKLMFLFDIYISINPYDEKGKERIIVHYEFRLHSSRHEKLLNLLRDRGKNSFIKIVVEIIDEGKISGEFRCDIPSAIIADMFWAMIDGVSLQTILYESYPYDEVLIQLRNMMMDTLKPKH